MSQHSGKSTSEDTSADREESTGPDFPRSIDRRQFVVASGLSGIFSAGCLGQSDDQSPTPTVDRQSTAKTPSGKSGGDNAKTRPTLWSQADRQNARENIEQFDWARTKKDESVEEADAILSQYSYDDIWNLVTSQEVARTSFISPDVHWDNAFYLSWEDLEESWKMTDGEYTFPTNNFAAYRESGRDDRGMFDPDLADDQYLVNEEHPEMGEQWGVDDGYGWQDTDNDLGEGADTWWNFVAYYNHWGVWRPGGVVRMARAFTDAYLLTGEQRYARPCAILLDRIADVYPEMDVSAYPSPRAGGHYLNTTGGSQTGKVIGAHWEPNLIRPVIRAYDAIFPGMEDDQELVAFLSQKSEEYPGLAGKDSIGGIRRNIEDGIIREILPAAKASQLAPNRGQTPAVTLSARVLDEPDGYTKEALNWVFQPGEEVFSGENRYAEPEKWKTTGGNVMAKLVDRTGRDGYMKQAAPLYNPIAQRSVINIGDLLQGYDAFDGADLYEHPKFHRMTHTHIEMLLLDKFIPSIGDTHPNELPLDWNSKRNAFEAYGEDVFGQAVHFNNGFTTEGLRGDIYDDDPSSLAEEIASVIDSVGPLDLDSSMEPSYGFTALRDGKNATVDPDADGEGNYKRAVWSYYGRTGSYGNHTHRDTLHLGVMAHGLNLAPDNGYPTSTGRWPRRIHWNQNTIAHNTVMVDEQRQESQRVGEPHHFDHSSMVQLSDVSAPDVYPQTEEYRRTTAMIHVDEQNSYAVDFFEVAGGDDHRFSFHGAAGDTSTMGLDLVEQDGGTYAGEDVPMPENVSEPESTYNEEVGNGFNYLDNVARDDDPSSVLAVDWDVEDYWDNRDDDADVHLRLTMLGEYDEVAVMDGHGPDLDDQPDVRRYAIAQRTGTDVESTFTSVIEPYVAKRFVDSIEHVDVVSQDGEETLSNHALKVTLTNGRTDYVARSPDRETTYTVDDTFTFDGFFAVYAEQDGSPLFAYLTDGQELRVDEESLIQQSAGRFSGVVEDFTREMKLDNEITVTVEGEIDGFEDTTGNHLYVQSSSDVNGVYPITDVSVDGDRATVNVGERTTIERYQNPEEMDDGGYEYYVAEGDSVYVPTSATWRSE